MSAPLDELYLSWLYQQVCSLELKNPSNTYWKFLRQLYTTEFVWLIPNDDNRIADGRSLRERFIRDEGIVDPGLSEWMSLECSVLEMLIALSWRLAFETEGLPPDWFWEMITNLGLRADQTNDRRYNDSTKEEIAQVIHNLVWRLYAPSGRGGLFPLMHEQQDQRRVEIWYQMNAYLLERF